SPTNRSSAWMLPTPKTTFLREEARWGHFTQAAARRLKSANAAALASGSSGAAGAAARSPGRPRDKSRAVTGVASAALGAAGAGPGIDRGWRGAGGAAAF